ncbi:Copper transport protein family, putative [Theobroma cacao]|uniref:Copper transport protein family, putative n=1 Tax=Theobroma cacao TaxID=3641 RepID=A0A061F4E0_THECC|nr:Copper transport protein family, putative [Theobroma cacao]
MKPILMAESNLTFTVIIMMQQKMVIGVNMECDRCRVKAFKVAAKTKWLESYLLLEGAEKDKLVVKGDGVDPVNLTMSLRKKVARAAPLLSVDEEKEKTGKAEKEEKGKGKDEKEEPTQMPCCYLYDMARYYTEEPIADENPSTYPMFIWSVNKLMKLP